MNPLLEQWKSNAFILKRSSAQVATSVAPKSCELKPGAKKRLHPLGVRFSDIELEIVKAKARSVGCTTNGYIRASALRSNYKPPTNPELTRALLILNRELTAQGRNLNQIAKHLNSGGSATDGQSMLDVIGHSMMRTHKVVRQALARDGVGPAGE